MKKLLCLLTILLLATPIFAVLPSVAHIEEINPEISCLQIEKIDRYENDLIINNCGKKIDIRIGPSKEMFRRYLREGENSADIFMETCGNKKCYLGLDSQVSEITFTTKNVNEDFNRTMRNMTLFFILITIGSKIWYYKTKKEKIKKISDILILLTIFVLLFYFATSIIA